MPASTAPPRAAMAAPGPGRRPRSPVGTMRARLTTNLFLAATLAFGLVAAPAASAESAGLPSSGAAAAPAGAPGQPGPSFGGAPVLGTRTYQAPATARYVSPTGSDSAAGTQAAPYRTIAKAIAAASAGQTIVLRAGSYHESLVIPTGKPLTIQPFGNEIVWLDGSSVVSKWTADGGRWRADNWTAEFDASPTYTRGAPDNTEEFWNFIDPAHPMAAHPDQVWIDGVAQDQVASLDQVRSGSFYVDYAANRLYLGSDPTGRTVRASDLSTAISVRADDSTLIGFGIARFAPSVPDMGAVTLERPRGRIENVVILDTATTGLSLLASDITVKRVTSARNGMLGVHADHADRLRTLGLSSLGNNVERFNSAPVSGGFKITRSRGIVITDGQLRDNLGPGLWLDQSTYGSKIATNKVINNSSHGIFVELSSTSTLVNNLVMGNGGFGLKINNTSSVRIWNNTIGGGDRSINIVQDGRLASNPSTPGHDARQPFPDPTMTWLNGPVEVRNNILTGTTGNCLLCVEDYSRQRSAEQMQISANGNVYQRPTVASPSWAVVWSTGAGNPKVFTGVAAFRAATGQEAASLALDGSAAILANGAPTAAVKNAVGSVAQPIPVDLRVLSGLSYNRLGSALTA